MPNIFIIKRLNSHTLLPCQISEEVSKCPQFSISSLRQEQTRGFHISGLSHSFSLLGSSPCTLFILPLPTSSGCPQMSSQPKPVPLSVHINPLHPSPRLLQLISMPYHPGHPPSSSWLGPWSPVPVNNVLSSLHKAARDQLHKTCICLYPLPASL